MSDTQTRRQRCSDAQTDRTTDLDVPDPEFGALVRTTSDDIPTVWTPR